MFRSFLLSVIMYGCIAFLSSFVLSGLSQLVISVFRYCFIKFVRPFVRSFFRYLGISLFVLFRSLVRYVFMYIVR